MEQRVEELREQISTASRYIISDLNSKRVQKEEWDLNLRGHPLLFFEKENVERKNKFVEKCRITQVIVNVCS